MPLIQRRGVAFHKSSHTLVAGFHLDTAVMFHSTLSESEVLLLRLKQQQQHQIIHVN